MNRVYKVIYNRARNLYQVVSEIVHSRGKTKSLTAQHQHERLTTAILIALFAMGTSLPVGWAADSTVSTAVTEDDANAVSGGAVYTEVQPTESTNTTYVKSDKTTAENLTALDTQVKQNTDAIAQKADTTALDAKADKTDLAAKADKTELDAKANTSMDNLTDAGKQAIQALIAIQNSDNVKVSSSTDDTNKTKTFTITVKTDGTVISGNTGLVTGDTVHSEVRPSANGTYVKVEKTTADNLTALDRQVNTNTTDISGLKKLSNISTDGKTVIKSLLSVVGDNDQVTVTPSDDVNGAKTYTVTVKKDGTIAADSDNLVTGKTVYEYLNSKVGTLAQDGNYIKRADSVSTNLSTLDTQIKNVIDAIGLDSDEATSYTSKLNKYFKVNPEITTNTDNTKTYAPDAEANGTNSVAIGPNAKTATYTTTVTSGDSTTTTETAADHAVAIGDGATVNAAGDQGIALGKGAVTGEAEASTSDGTTTTTTDAKGGESSVAIGDTAKASGNQALAFGKGASVLNPAGTGVSTGSTAIGSGAKVDGGNDSIALGTSAAVNTVSNAMALGNGATINKTAAGSIAIGNAAVTGSADKPITLTNSTTGTLAAAGGVDSIAIGNGAVSEGNEALALGKGAKVTNAATGGDSAAAIVKNGSAAIGDGAEVANSATSMAIGNGASITEGENTTVIGSGANAAQTKQAFVAGYQASSDSSAESSVAIGDTASTHSARTTAIGYNAEAHYADSIAIGSEAKTDDNGGGIAIGNKTSVAQGGIAIGNATQAINISSLAIGNGAAANVNQSISIGYNAGVNTSEDYKERNGSLVAIGTSAGNNVKGMQNVAIGASAGSSVLSSNNIAIGTNAGYGIKNVTSETDTNPQNGYNISIGAGANYTEGNTNQNIVSSIAIGHNTHAANRAVALGEGASAQGDAGMALGNSATSSGSGSIAIGNTASAANGNVAIGAGAHAIDQPTGAGKWTNTAPPSYYISVGGKGNASDSTITLRRISNVADGSADQDVVTVKQLQKVSDDLENTIKGIDTTQLKTYSTKEIDNKIAEVNQKIKDSGIKYFSINSASQSTNSNNTGANGDGDADAMAIGPNAKASSVKALAIGNNVSASGTLSIAIGTASNPSTDTTTAETPHPTSSEGTSSVAIGTSAIAQTNDSIAIGTRAATYTANTTSTPVSTVGVQSVAIGFSAETRDDNAISIGTKSKANSADAVAIGDGAEALNTSAVVIGKASTAEGSDSVTIGMSNANNGKAVITTGNSNQITNSQGVKDTVQNSGLYGSSNAISSVSSSNTSNAITDVYAVGNGNKLNQMGEKNVLTDVSIMGNKNTIENGTAGAYTQTVKQIAVVGSGNTVKGNTQVDATTWGTVQRDTILGYKNTVDATTQWTPVSNLQILGNDVTATLGNSVYLGTGSSATASKSATAEAITLAKEQGDAEAIASDEYKKATTEAEQTAIKQKYEAQYIHAANIAAMDQDGISAGITNYDKDYTYGNDSVYTYAGSQATGVVTVGSKDATRRIQNVSAGLVGPNSTDAVNGSQLYALTRQIRFGGDNSTFGDVATSDVNVVAKGSNEKLAITGGAEGVSNTTTTDGKSVTTVDGTKIADKNIAVIAEDDALHVKLASNLKDLNTAQLGKTTATTTKADDGTETTTYSYQETLKLDGTGDNGGTLALKDAKGENGVTLRTSGATKTADVTGAETNRLLVNDKTVATTDDGLKFGGDTGNVSALKLNNKLNVKGGADTTKLTDNNIGVVSDGSGTLTVKLSKNVNLGADGSLTTGGTVTATTVNATTVKTGASTLTTSGLSIANGPSVLTSGINAGNKKITSVTAGETDTDAANYGQVKAAKTTLTQGSNVTITPDTTSDDKHTNYTVSVSNLSYKAGTDTTAKNVTLSNGLTFQNGKNTTAVAGDNGTIIYNLNDKIELGAETDSNNHIVVDGTQGLLTLGMDATINGNAGIASIGGVSIGKSGSDQVITGLTNKTWTVGTTQAVDGRAATENQLQSVADNLNTANTNIATLQHGFKVQANGDTTTESTVKADDALNFTAGDNTNVTTTKDSKQITISVDNLSVKDNNGTAQSVKLADGLNFQDGTNTMAVVGTNGSVTYDLKSSITLGTSTDEANRIIVNGTNGTITVGNLATINGNAGTASIGGVSIGKSGSGQTVTGLSNRTWVVGKSTAVNGRAATEDQLQSVSNAAYTNANNITMLQQGFTVTTNNDTDKKSTVKAGDNLNFQAGKNVQISTTADSKSIEVALSGTPEFTTVTSKDASGNTTIVSSTGVTITPNGTGTQSVSLTSEGLDNGNHVIKNVASGGDTDTNAANISDVKRLVQASASGTTETGFNVKGDDATSKKVKLGKQLNVVGGTNDTSKLSDGNIGVVTTDDGQGNATLTVKLNKNITLDSVTTGSTTLNTSGVSNGDMSLTNTGFVIKNNDASKQVSVTTNGVFMGSQRIQNVANAEVDTDAATLGQVKNARTVVAGGSNVAGITPAKGANNQMTYTVNVDNLSVKANKEEAKSVTLKNGLTFNNGTNTTASVGEEGVVSFGLKPEISLTKVTTGNTTMDTNGLAISGGPTIAAGGINAGGKTITGVANGVGDNDAVNISQLKAVQSDINAGWTIKGKDTANADVNANIGKGKTVTYNNGSYTKAVVTKDDSGNAAVTVDVTTGTLTTGTDGKITSADGLATTGDVASAVNGASWTIQDGNHTKNAQQVKAGDTVSLKAGDNLSLEQNGKEFTYKLNQTLTNMSSVTAVDDKQNTAVLNGEGLKVTDAQGNALTQHATEVRLHDANKAADDTTTDVVLNKQGLQNGGHTVTGVADGTVDASSQDAVNGSQLYALQQKVTNGWKITGADTTKASNIGNDKTVSFVNGDNSYIKAKVDTTNTGATVSYTAQTASLMKNADGKAALNGTTDGLVTGTNLTNVLNSLSWTAQSSKTGTGQNNGSTTAQSITAGTDVGFIAGDNMILTQNGTNFTYALNSNLTGMNTIAFTGLGNGASNLTIGLQNGGGANSDKGYYITGLSNTKWDQSNYEGTRAATEAQLREAIDKVSAATGTGGFGLTADEGANNGGEKKVSQTLGRTIAIQGDGTYGADGTVVKQGNISTVAYTDNAGPTGAIKVKLNKDIDLSEAGSLTIGASKVSAGSIVLDNTGDAAKKIALNSTAGTASIGGVTVNGAAKTVMGLANTTWDGTAVSGRAATEDQLAKAISDVSEQATNSELHIRKGTYSVGKDKDGQDVADPKGKNSVSIDVVNATGTVDGQVVINDVAKASELGAVGELAANLKNPAGGPTTVVQAVNKVNQKVDDSLKRVNGDITSAVTEAKKHTKVAHVDGDSNVIIDGTQKTDDNGTVYKLGLNKEHVDLNQVHIYGNDGRVKTKTVEVDDKTKLDKTGLTTGNTTVADGRVVIGGDNGIKIEAKGDQQTISGLSNRIWTGKAVSGRAATEDQLQQAVENATATAAQNEQHIQSGNYDVGQGKGLDGKPIGKNSVAINVVSGDGTKPGDVKGQVVINNVAKADELGDVAKLNGTVRNGNGHPTSTVDAINNLDNRVETKVGDNTYSRVKGKEIDDGDSATTAIGKLNNRMNDIYTTAGQHSTVSTVDANLTLSEGKNASGGTDYKLGLNKEHIDLGNVTINGNAGSIESKSMKSDAFTAGDTVVNKDGVKVGDKSALTGDSLKVGGKTYVDDKGIDANGKAIGNVGDGKNDGDAVNVKQVNDLAARQGEAIGQNAAHINQLDRAVNRLDSRINRVGAGAAALAALHPGNYDPDDKVDFAAGFGNYRGASAAAVGMYYHPDETTTMSVGASFGGGENMVNAGITWKMGKDSGHMRTQAATKAVPVQFVAAPTQTQQSSGQAEGTKMPQPVTAVTTTASGQQVPIVAAYLPSVDSSTRAENDELKELLARQTAILEKLADQKTAPAQAAAPVSGEDLFPDVPENHWAYDFVAKLAQAGALKDCRVEDPANNPMLTRNDFAQILYTALKNGATKNPALNKDGGLNHLANEFRAELKNVKR